MSKITNLPTQVHDMGITEQCLLVHEHQIAKGHWDHEYIELPEDPSEPRYAPPRRIANPSIYEEKIALIMSEGSEIIEKRRDNDEVGEAEECADLLIRLMDYCGARGFDLGAHYVAVMEKNAKRPYRHGRNR